jgi:hypothetical protein
MAYTKYSLTPADNNAAPPNGAPEGMLPSAVNDTMRDMMAQIRDVGDGIRGGTYTMTAPVITGGSVSGATGSFSTLAASGVSTFSAGTVSAPAITTTGDTNTGIFFPAADTIAFTEGGTEVMRINSSGNVGVGTNVPESKLNIVGDQLIVAGGTGTSQLGIQIKGTALNALPTAQVQGYIATGDSGLGVAGDLLIAPRTSVGASVRFITGTTPAERMRIDSSGNVGIGITPTAKFHVSGTIQTQTGSTVLQMITDGGSNYLQAVGAYPLELKTTGSAPMVLHTNNTERMRITSAGDVGIGTSSPSSALQISRTGTASLTTSSTSGGGNWEFGVDAGGNGFVYSGQSKYLAVSTSGSERMRINSSGAVLVGDTATGAYFDGNLNVFKTGNIPFCAKTDAVSAYVGSFHNTATSGNNNFLIFLTETSPNARGSISYNRGAGVTAYNTTSDYRAKDIISPVLDSGEVIDSVPVYMGKMKDATQARPMFIAHETPDYAHTGEKDAVDKDGNPVYQQMDASALVPVLWAEVQSLRKRLAVLESK